MYFNDGTSTGKNTIEREEENSFQLDFRFFRTPAFIGTLLLFTSLFVILSAVLLWLQIFSSPSNSSNASKLFTFCTSRHLNSEQQLLCRRAFIRNMTLEAFNAYKKYAWGAAELGPLSKMPSKTRLRAYPGLTIIDAMSTLWLMDLKTEWAEGLHWIEQSMPPYSTLNQTLRVKEAVVDSLGGLLSAYALSSEPVLLEKAMEVFLMLDSISFNRNTSFLTFKINPVRKETTLAFSYNKLANVGFEQPELIWLAQLTNNQRLQRRLATIRSRLTAIGRKNFALYPSMLELANGTAASDSVVSFSEDSRDFYYNMIQASIQKGERRDKELLLMYNKVIEAMRQKQIFMAIDGRLTVRDYDPKKKIILDERGMEGSACQLGAMLAQGAQLHQTDKSTKRLHMQLAINLTETCYHAAMATQVKMVPKRFAVDGKLSALDVTAYLTNELPESYFILWRLTGNQVYRDRAWQHVESLYRHCRTANGGYSSLANITTTPPTQFDYQFPSFFSHTLKYLWLTFADHQMVLPLERWFFNTRGHPLPICGTSANYPKEMCR